MTSPNIDRLYDDAQLVDGLWEKGNLLITDEVLLRAHAIRDAVDLVGMIHAGADAQALAMQIELLTGNLGFERPGIVAHLLGERV